ncbi:hypothetical protein SAMN05421690_100655 [Nitrosomonas sp. Nm51]|uniref:hypothetical protein n=1 Tax=Nitrosomonas sp. Nm51 TaxID=133720 RepID=UPI0008CD267B|nr:hypothetical protein [Nitrosomonas sp. Nm51]SER03721.1 hypothetical protein SAMN05421690_100655 [Nitrosomonas sp. Nm51]
MTAKSMRLIVRRELQASIRGKYRDASWPDKRKILDGFVAATGYGRKYAIQQLSSDEMPVLPKNRFFLLMIPSFKYNKTKIM